eukprot:symbB.v1.2.007362.t1/scaffold451.1/size378644/8
MVFCAVPPTHLGEFHFNVAFAMEKGGVLDMPLGMGSVTVGLGWDVDQGEVDLDVSAVLLDARGEDVEAFSSLTCHCRILLVDRERFVAAAAICAFFDGLGFDMGSEPVSPASSTSQWVRKLNSCLDDATPRNQERDSFGSSDAPATGEVPFVPNWAGSATFPNPCDHFTGINLQLANRVRVAFKEHHSGRCDPCLLVNSPLGCRHGAMCAYCHLEHPKVSVAGQNRPRKLTRDKIKARIEHCLRGPPDQVHASLQVEASAHAYARSLINGYLDEGLVVPQPRLELTLRSLLP